MPIMGLHRIYCESSLPPAGGVGTNVQVGGDEAHHAIRVKRVVAGDRVELRDGRGGVASARVAATHKSKSSGEWELVLAVESVAAVPPREPDIEVCTAAPKGDHLEEMVDQLSQLGANRWRMLECEHGVVEPRTGKLDRLRRRALESMKQSGRAWLMEIGEPISFAAALGPREAPDARTLVLVAEAGGGSVIGLFAAPPPRRVRLLVGPEAGWSPAERDELRRGLATLVSFAPDVLRIETAAAAGVAAINAALRSLQDAAQQGQT